MSKPFNALSGLELKTIILKELEQQLGLDARFDDPTPIQSAMLVFSLRVEWYPGGETPIALSVSDRFASERAFQPTELRTLVLSTIKRNMDADLRFGHNLTYPKVTYKHVLDLTVTRPDGARVETTIVPRAIETRVEPERVLDLRAPVQAPVVPTDELSVLKARIAEIEARSKAAAGGGSYNPNEPEVVVKTSAVPTRHRDFNPETATGLKMDFGFKESPGIQAAMSAGSGSVVGAISRGTEERIVLGNEHPPIDEGGIGRADAVRRQAGLPVPEPVQVRGQTVDVPAGTF